MARKIATCMLRRSMYAGLVLLRACGNCREASGRTCCLLVLVSIDGANIEDSIQSLGRLLPVHDSIARLFATSTMLRKADLKSAASVQHSGSCIPWRQSESDSDAATSRAHLPLWQHCT